MTVLASIEGLVIWVVIAAIAGIGKLVEKANAKKTPPSYPARRPTSHSPVGGTTEEERTRKFLEALGLPTTAVPTKVEEVRRASETLRPTAAPVAPPPATQQMRGGREALPHTPPAMARTEIEARRIERKLHKAEGARRSAPPARPERPYGGEIEHVHFEELKTPGVPLFQTRASEVSAIPFERTEVKTSGAATARHRDFRTLARSRDAIRQAILLREILGPPRSLQTDWPTPNFPLSR